MKTHAFSSTENNAHTWERQPKKSTQQGSVADILQAYLTDSHIFSCKDAGCIQAPRIPGAPVCPACSTENEQGAHPAIQRKLIIDKEPVAILPPEIEREEDVDTVYILGSWLREEEPHPFGSWPEAMKAARQLSAQESQLRFFYPGKPSEPLSFPLGASVSASPPSTRSTGRPGLPPRPPRPSSLSTSSPVITETESKEEKIMMPPIFTVSTGRPGLPPRIPRPSSLSISSPLTTETEGKEEKMMTSPTFTASSGMPGLPPRIPRPSSLSTSSSITTKTEGEKRNITEELVLEALQNQFARIHSHIFTPINEETSQEKAAHYASQLFQIQTHLQEIIDRIAPNRFRCLVRFYVKENSAPPSHPGLNSWAYFRSLQPPVPSMDTKTPETAPDEIPELQPAASSTDISKAGDIPIGTANTHMLLGHDVGTATVTGSPFVSTTENVRALLQIDSPYNFFGKLQSRVSSQPIITASGTQPAAEARYYSERIAVLTHGISPDLFETNTKAMNTSMFMPVATHIAFLAVPLHRLHFPPGKASPVSCCRLEKEVTIYAPDVDLARWVVGETANILPELTGNLHHTSPPSSVPTSSNVLPPD